MFVIQDERHAEVVGEFATEADAMVELRRLAQIPWDQAPNTPPCQGWRTCGRRYALIEYEVVSASWRELGRRPVLDVSSIGVAWTS